MKRSKVFASCAASVDGYIASPTRDLAWLNNAMSPDEDYGFAETMQRTGAYVMGANTYQEVLAMGPAGGGDTTPTYVVTHRADWPKAADHIRFYAGDLRTLVEAIRTQTDKDIWIFGGGDLVTQCLELDLLDEISLGLVPVLLGAGVPLFRGLTAQKGLRLVECKPFPSGIVRLQYARSTDPALPHS